MLQSGTRILLAALAAGFVPTAAFSQNIIALDGSGSQAIVSASGEVASTAATRDVITPDGMGYRVDVFGATPNSRVVVAQNLVTQNGNAPVPNVNDCTFIRDPVALRDCINLYEGQRLGPGPRTNALRSNLITDEALIDAAGPIPGSTRGRSGSGRERVTAPDLKRSNAAYIEQVTPSR
ncbi:hypothetical protein [Methylobacterium sp. R2-1]|uniref:hypothetical protein n=1 Tax=Methylobacterium sp. R2-1 TaxID=2587064 RepID=UPI00161C0CC0|nr:hypothetical protein [Methylobacterium sp. R2-1]MBB2963121.1 hypothetical protein [Methylobacterium sp. R2-1]